MAQEGLWLIEATRGETDIYPYNEVFCFRLRGILDPGALAAALSRIVARHEIWRTSIQVGDGIPLQQVADAIEVSIESVHWDATDSTPIEHRLSAFAHAEARIGFDLARGPLWRAHLAELGRDDHALLLTLHHLIFDGWSIGVLGAELAAIYQAFAAGDSDPLGPLAIQYADFAAAERRELTDAKLAGSLRFWTDKLRGSPAQLELPTDRPRPIAASGRGGQVVRRLPPPLGHAVRALAEGEQVTLFPLLLAALQALLARYSHQDDIVVGTTVANRTSARFRKLLGYFANTLALRRDLSDDPSFRALLQRTRDDLLDAYRHSAVPFHLVVKAVQPERSSGRVPLVQVLLVLDNTPPPPRELAPSLSLEVSALDAGTAKFDLTIFVADDGDDLRLTAEYDADLFEPATVERLLGHYENLLASLAADPDCPVSKLSLLGPTERRQLLVDWASGVTQPQSEATIPERFEQTARANPDAVAVEFEGEALTYAALNRRADQLAARLRRLGVGPEVVVGVCMERSLDLVVSLLAVLKSGGAYVPLDPAYPPERASWMLQDSGARVLLTCGAGVDLPGFDGRWIDVSAKPAEVDGDAPAAVAAGPENLAYILFTSGSTGRPKGVMNHHGGLTNRLLWMAEELGLEPGDAIVQKTPFTFDVSVWEFFLPLITGARLVVARPGGHRDPGYLAELLRTQRITIAHFVPSMLAAFLDATEEPVATSVRAVIASGEALSPHLQSQFFARSGAQLVNLYGPTEAAIDVSIWRCRVGDHAVPIGRPIANTQLYVLDRDLEPVPPGVIGELYIGGVQLARGYVSRPDLTAERFVPCPHAGPGERLYRTGDLARWRSDRSLEYLGRTDHQLKVRGFRIEPGEIESALVRHEQVRAAVVLAPQEADGRTRLVAYVVPRPGEPIAVSTLRDFLAATLPEYMVPSVFVSIDSIPRTANGKIDRNALERLRPQVEPGSAMPPVGETEKVLAALYERVLGVAPVGADGDFFALGGHSLLATRLAARINKELGVAMPLGAVFDAPTVRQLARRIEAARGRRLPPPIRPTGRPPGMEPSFTQTQLWLTDQLVPDSPRYNLTEVARITGPVDEALLRQSGDWLIRRHEALRTRFESSGGRPRAVIDDDVELWMDTRQIASENEVRQLVREEAEQPFDLARGPLARAVILRLSDQERWLLVTVHHIVGDGWSIALLFQELAEVYAVLAAGRSPRAAAAIQYADFAAWQRDWLRGEVIEELLAYWTRQLEGHPRFELRGDRPRPAQLSYRAGLQRFGFGPATTAAIKELARSEGATLYMVAMAMFAVLLHRRTGDSDLVIGSGIANRNQTELEGLIGCFASPLPIRVRVDRERSFAELLSAVRTTALDAYAHHDLPFATLVEALRPERERNRHPVFDVALTIQTAPPRGLALGEARLEILPPEITRSHYDLELHLWEQDDRIESLWIYCTDLFDPETIGQLVDGLDRICQQVVRAPDRPLRELDPLGDTDRHKLLVEWNDTAASHPPGSVPELIARQASLTPDAPAVISDRTTLSYRELVERSTALASHLRGRGVGPEVRVGVCMERSPELVVALLGVLEAGGAYVPLDPDHPAERRRFMVEDSRAQVVLTDADWPAIASAAPRTPPSPVAPDTTAYVIYTSGSTGRPKGVMIPHRALANHTRWMQDQYPLSADDAVLQKTAISFDASVWEFWAPLVAGARLVMARPGGQREPGYLVDAIQRHRVTTLQVVPTLLAALVDEPGLSSTPLRRVFCGGEALSSALARRLFARTSAELVNLYGPTEVTIDATSWQCRRDDDGIDVPIGRPIANVRAYVLDPRQELVPRGAIGELYLAGAGLGRGYVGQPALTAERFLPDPHSPVPGRRMYRTGDRVRHRHDGSLEFLGRVDHQIKLRGVRIELTEIESVLAGHPRIHQAAVIASEVDSGPPRLVAYFSPRGAESPTASELGEFLRAWLPEAMVPARFIELATLPQLPSGKIDRSALPDPEPTASPPVAAQTAVERIVADVFAQVLGVDSVGAEDHFFELGGHSLLAMQAAVRIGESLGIEVPLFALLEAPTVRELAAQLEQTDRGRARATAIEQVARRPRMVASFAQRRLWFADRLVPDNPFYNQATVMQIDGPLDEGAMAAAVDALVRRHEPLRTRFVDDGGEPSQVIEDRADVWWGVDQVGEAEAARLAAAEAERPFDLETGPVIRAGLLRLSPERRWLLLTNHHIAGDGWSTGLLYEELGALYGAFAQGRESPLPPLEVQYADFAEWQRQQLRGPALDDLLRYWTDQLAGCERLALQTDRPRPAQPTHRGGSVELDFGPELSDGLRRLARREDATLYMVLLAAFIALLARQTRQQDIVVGTGNASRNHSALEHLIGFFVNLLPMRVRLDGASTFDELLQRVKQTVLGALAHQDLPFDRLVEALRPPREPGEHPLFGVALTLQNAPSNRPQFPGVTTTVLQSEELRTRLDLELHVWEDDDSLKCTCVYSAELFDRQTIARLADRYQRMCREIAR